LSEKTHQKAVRILSPEVYRGFRPTLASNYLPSKHTLRIGAGNAAADHDQRRL